MLSGNPVGKYGQCFIGLGGIIVRQVEVEIVFAIHPLVHHKLHRNGGAFAWSQRHRTDDRCGWSAPIHNFDEGLFGKPQGAVTHVGDLEGNIRELVEFHVAQVNHFLVHLQAG